MEASCGETIRSDALSLSRHLNLHGQLLSGESNLLYLRNRIPYQIDKFETEGNIFEVYPVDNWFVFNSMC